MLGLLHGGAYLGLNPMSKKLEFVHNRIVTVVSRKPYVLWSLWDSLGVDSNMLNKIKTDVEFICMIPVKQIKEKNDKKA